MSAVPKLRWKESELRPERSLFENAPLGIARFQADGCLDLVNPQLEKVIAYTPASQLGNRPKTDLRFSDLIHTQADGEKLLKALFAGERENFLIESSLCSENGRPLQWTAWRVAGANGEPDYAIASAQAIPESREAADQRRHNAKLEMLGRLAGGVAHDFNNLLTGVLLYCDLLMASLGPGARERKYTEEIRNATVQATGLVKQLLAVARPTKLEPRLLSLNEMVEGMRTLLLRLIGENIGLKFDLDPNLGLVKMDLTQAQQILLNLVLNARDAMPSGGQISVSTSNCRVQILSGAEAFGSPSRCDSSFAGSDDLSLPCALFVVRDNGCGMDADTRARLFEAFFTTKSGGKGTGLGLATVYDIVTGSGGLIHVDSHPGCGTRFSVLLPLVPDAALASTPTSEDSNSAKKIGTQNIEGEFSAVNKTGVQP